MNDLVLAGVVFAANVPAIAGAFEQLAATGFATMANAAEQHKRSGHDLDPDRVARLRGQRYLAIRGSW